VGQATSSSQHHGSRKIQDQEVPEIIVLIEIMAHKIKQLVLRIEVGESSPRIPETTMAYPLTNEKTELG
jgi:hypothetical protein